MSKSTPTDGHAEHQHVAAINENVARFYAKPVPAKAAATIVGTDRCVALGLALDRGLPKGHLAQTIYLHVASSPKAALRNGYINRSVDEVLAEIGTSRSRFNKAFETIPRRLLSQRCWEGTREFKANVGFPKDADMADMKEFMSRARRQAGEHFVEVAKIIIDAGFHRRADGIALLVIARNDKHGTGERALGAMHLSIAMGVCHRRAEELLIGLQKNKLLKVVQRRHPLARHKLPSHRMVDVAALRQYLADNPELTAQMSPPSTTNDKSAVSKSAVILEPSTRAVPVDGLDGAAAAVTAPQQALGRAAGKGALRRAERVTTATTQPATAEKVARGPGGQEADLPTAHCRQGRGISGSVGSGYPINGRAGWSSHTLTVPGYAQPPATSPTAKPAQAAASTADSDGAGIRQHGDRDLTATTAAEGVPDWLGDAPRPDLGDYGWHNAEAA